MNATYATARNPFATRYVRPGAMAFVFEPGESAAALVDRLQRHAWRGEIVGPHGSGKSTLLMALLGELRERRVPTIFFTLHDGQRHLPDRGVSGDEGCLGSSVLARPQYFTRQLAGGSRVRSTPGTRLCGTPAQVVVVDGYEQLSLWSRWRLMARCRMHGWGLLVTTHEARGLPLLYRTEPRLNTLRMLVAQLAPDADAWLTDDHLQQQYNDCRGDLRETLFALYTLHEQRARSRAAF